MNVIFVGRFLGGRSISLAQMKLIKRLHQSVDNFLLIGEFSQENKKELESYGVQVIEKHDVKKIDPIFIKELKEIATSFQPDIVHVIHGKLLRSVNVAFKNHSAKIITYFGSTSLHWHDISSYLTFLSPRVDKIICNSEHVYQHVRKQLLWRKQKAVKIYKGYNPEWFEDTKMVDYTTLKIPKNAIVVVLAATYSKNKRVEDFIQSSQYLQTEKEVHYVVLGHDTNGEALQKLKNESPIKDNIHLLGVQNDAVSFIKGGDIYAQTSLKEGFGRAVSEAMCVGKPIVMTNCGGGTELIDKNTGIVVPTKNPKAIAEAISTLVNDDELREKMGKNAFKRISSTYHIRQTVEEVLMLYRNVINN